MRASRRLGPTDDQAALAARFEAHRSHLRHVAHRLLGSEAAAEDAVQEAWLRLGRTEARGIDNLGGWLTIVVSRVCLDVLRARRSRPEDQMGDDTPEPAAEGGPGADPEQEAVLADSLTLVSKLLLSPVALPTT